jgi:hypothetical protein
MTPDLPLSAIEFWVLQTVHAGYALTLRAVSAKIKVSSRYKLG